jgi:HAE1 family hydrophobic/amphiphilic exporter-1
MERTNMTLTRTLTASLCLTVASIANAQQPLTLADATSRALAKNHAIRVEREQVAAADARVRGSLGAYDVHLSVDVNGRHHRDPINSLFSGAPDGRPAASQNSFTSSMSLSQRFRTGAIASASTSVSREGTDGMYSPFAPTYTSSLGVDLQQPLLRNRVIDPSRTALLVTALDRDRSSAALTSQVLQTVADVEKAYWNLVAARRELNVRQGSLALAEQQRIDTQARIDARTAAVSDLAQPTAEVERRRGELLSSQESVVRAERALKLLIIDDLEDPIWARELVPGDAPDTPVLPVDVAGALAQARRNRPEIAEISAAGSAQDLEIRLARDQLKPRMDLVASYTIRGMAGERESTGLPLDIPVSLPSSLNGGLGNSWSNLFDQKFPDLVVGVSFDVPLGRREAHAAIAATEADRRRIATTMAGTQERIAAEVLNAATALETAAGRIQAALAGRTAAQTQLRAEQDRFSAGLSTNFFVLTRQNDLALAYLAEIAALTDYRKAQTEFARAKGSLLEDRNIRINCGPPEGGPHVGAAFRRPTTRGLI